MSEVYYAPVFYFYIFFFNYLYNSFPTLLTTITAKIIFTASGIKKGTTQVMSIYVKAIFPVPEVYKNQYQILPKR